MNSSQIHLALTHIPVILSMTGMVLLGLSMVKKNLTLATTSLYLLLAAGLFSLPVFFSGEGAEETVEHLPGISENIIEEHEEAAKIGFIIILAAATAALMAIIVKSRQMLFRAARLTTFILAVITSVAMLWVAHLGGQIRHTEISTASVTNQESGGDEGEKDHHED